MGIVRVRSVDYSSLKSHSQAESPEQIQIRNLLNVFLVENMSRSMLIC